MTFRTISNLFPIPQSVINCLALISKNYAGKKVLVSPHCELVANLYWRGFLDGFDFVGAIDRDSSKHGRYLYGMPVYDVNKLDEVEFDAIFVIHAEYHEQIFHSLKLHFDNKVDVIDVCRSYNREQYRHELAAYFSLQNIDVLHSGFPNNRKFLSGNLKDVEIIVEPGWGLGDRLCALVAAREYAKKFPNLNVRFNDLPNVVSAYEDELISKGKGSPVPDNINCLHRTVINSPAGNYLGCFLLGLGLDFDGLPKLNLPAVEVPFGLTSGKYIALQPSANYAKPNIDVSSLQKIIDACPIPVVLTGPLHPVNAKNIDVKDISLNGALSDFYGDEMAMLKIISHAALVITPRSASAHIASAYNVPTIAWVPNDGENWHLNYPEWHCQQVDILDENVVPKIISLIEDFFENKTLYLDDYYG